MQKTYGELVFSEEDNIWRIVKAQPHVIIKLKKLFPKISQVARPPFEFINTLEVCSDLDWFLMRYPMEMKIEDSNRLKIRKHLFEQRNTNFEKILAPEYIPRKVNLKEPYELRNYQASAVELLHKNKALLLGDDLGLGKTITGIGHLLGEGTLPAFIVVPTHLAHHWKDKIKEMTNLKSYVIKGTQPYELPVKDVYIIKYSCLPGWIDLYETLNFKTVIFDEVHYLRRAESMRYQAAEEMVKKAEYKLGMSATPVFNRGEEIFNILEILNKGCLGFRDDFIREWTRDGKIISEPKALGTYLRDNFYFLRRTKQDVGRELPNLNKIVQAIDFDQKTVENAESLMKTLAHRVLNGSNMEQGQAARELDILMRKITGIAKAEAVAEYVKILLDNDVPVLLVGWHRDVYDIWDESFKNYKPLYYTGQENPNEKYANAQSFMKGDTKLLIMSLASGEGLDGLQHICSDIVIGELAWSPAVHDQIIGRLNRDGQKDQVTAHFLVTSSGSDPLMIELLGLKASQAQDIVDPTLGIQQVVAETSRMKMLAERILKKKQKDE